MGGTINFSIYSILIFNNFPQNYKIEQSIPMTKLKR